MVVVKRQVWLNMFMPIKMAGPTNMPSQVDMDSMSLNWHILNEVTFA